MPTVAEALRQHAGRYLVQYAHRMPAEHRRVLALITRCRTGQLGHLHYQCDGCRRRHWLGRSCGNRHCPNCQSDKTQRWLAKRTAELLPVPYYLVTFTVPQALRKIVRANGRDCYQALFDAGSQTIRQLASGPRFIGTDRLGFFGALHTWGRDFTVYHPHVHFVVPGGGVSQDGSRWQAAPANFLLPEKAASVVRVTGLAEPVGVTRYVTLDSSVSGERFVRGFLQHTLPRNFQRLRYYGFASPNSKLRFEWVRMLVWFYLGWCYLLTKRAAVEPIRKPPLYCSECGGRMHLVAITDAGGALLYNHPLPYLDSG